MIDAGEVDFLRSNALLNVYIAWFSGRTDLYVKNAAEVVREPITPDVIRHALEHRYAISAYTGTEEGKTHVGAIDFDTEEGLAVGRQVVVNLDAQSIPSLLVQSRRGAHLWVIGWEPVDTSTMRRALVAALPETHRNLTTVEVFPKAGSGLACGALRLPRMHHQQTGEVYPVWVFDSEAWSAVDEGLMSLLEATLPAEMRALEHMARSLPDHRPYPKGLGTYYAQKRDLGPTPNASEVLANWGVQVRPGQTVRCPKHDDRRRSLTVFRDDQRVFCGSPGCVLNGSGHGVGSVQLSLMEV